MPQQTAQIFSTKECAWSQTSMKLLGRTIVGLRGFEFKLSFEKELLFAAGNVAIDIQEGNESSSGNISALKYEVDLLNDAALAAGYKSILHVPHILISCTCQFKKTATSASRIIEVPTLAFTDLTYAMQQNAKMTEVPLPWIAQTMIIR